jgi:hypothetical protein
MDISYIRIGLLFICAICIIWGGLISFSKKYFTYWQNTYWKEKQDNVVRPKYESESLGRGVRCFGIRDRPSVLCTLPNALSMKFHPLAIFLDVVTDIVLSVISSVGLSLFGVNTNDPGACRVAVGGYVTGIISSSSKEFNVVVFGVVEILIGLLISAFVVAPLWFNVVSFVLIIPSALLGAYVAAHLK